MRYMTNNPKIDETLCPECGKISKFIPPAKQDETDKKKLIVNFICPCNHKFTKILILK